MKHNLDALASHEISRIENLALGQRLLHPPNAERRVRPHQSESTDGRPLRLVLWDALAAKGCGERFLGDILFALGVANKP